MSMNQENWMYYLMLAAQLYACAAMVAGIYIHND